MKKIVYLVLKTTNGVKKYIKTISVIHVNTLTFSDGTTASKSSIEEINDWIDVKEFEPDTAVIALGYQDEIIIGYIASHGNYFECENEHELLDEVTHWKPKPLTIKERNKLFNN